jgi:hypothetical protein
MSEVKMVQAKPIRRLLMAPDGPFILKLTGDQT